jgi:hypothetical protein
MKQHRDITYTVRVSHRARRCRIQVGLAGVTLVVPRRMPMTDAESFLRQNADWIQARLAATRNATPPLPPGTGLYRGEQMDVPVSNRAMTAWLRRQARTVIHAEVATWSRLMGLRPARVFLRNQRTRWGSCSSRGNISLNWRLIMAPPDVLTYVVIHELAHLAEPHHGPGFWALVSAHCPEYRNHKAWLKKHGHFLHQLV